VGHWFFPQRSCLLPGFTVEEVQVSFKKDFLLTGSRPDSITFQIVSRVLGSVLTNAAISSAM